MVFLHTIGKCAFLGCQKCCLECSCVGVDGFLWVQCKHFLVKMYAKLKGLGPVEGHAPPRSANEDASKVYLLFPDEWSIGIITYCPNHTMQ